MHILLNHENAFHVPASPFIYTLLRLIGPISWMHSWDNNAVLLSMLVNFKFTRIRNRHDYSVCACNSGNAALRSRSRLARLAAKLIDDIFRRQVSSANQSRPWTSVWFVTQHNYKYAIYSAQYQTRFHVLITYSISVPQTGIGLTTFWSVSGVTL